MLQKRRLSEEQKQFEADLKAVQAREAAEHVKVADKDIKAALDGLLNSETGLRVRGGSTPVASMCGCRCIQTEEVGARQSLLPRTSGCHGEWLVSVARLEGLIA